MAWCFRLGPFTVSDHIPQQILSRFDVNVGEHAVGDHRFRILEVCNPDTLLDDISPSAFAVDERLPYWAELWTSSLALAGHCLEQPSLHGLRVLDLGCGLGLAGIAAARNGASVLLADYDQDAMLFAEWNARANLDGRCLTRTRFRVADWREPEALGTFDVVLGADIVYERRTFVPLLSCLQTVLSSGGEAWLAEPDRSLGSEFFAFARDLGWTIRMTDKHLERRGRTSVIHIAMLAPGGHA
jgi:predicted nicotinamide N-methyase